MISPAVACLLRITVPLSLLAVASPAAEMKTVPSVDFERYAGKWYEIARLPNRFQRHCASDTSATYTLRPDRKITVLNQCRTSDGKTRSAKGTARLASDTGPNSRLKVTFFWPFSGHYWIIGLDDAYRWAVIGEPDRKYLWILSRDPKIDDGLYQRLLLLARGQGYDLTRMIRTPQNGV